MKFSMEVLEYLVVKLSAIIDDVDTKEPKSAYDGLPKEVFDLILDNVRQEFYFHLFSEVSMAIIKNFH